MTPQSRSMRNLFVSALLVGVFTLFLSEDTAMADEVPAFFLKIAKNIPRVGRSDGYQESLFKPRTNIDKVGHEGGAQPGTWSYANQEPFTRPIKRRMDYPSDNDEWSWQHFPLAIEGPTELWRTLAGYSKDASDDIDNEIWQRKKRTGNEPTASQGN